MNKALLIENLSNQADSYYRDSCRILDNWVSSPEDIENSNVACAKANLLLDLIKEIRDGAYDN